MRNSDINQIKGLLYFILAYVIHAGWTQDMFIVIGTVYLIMSIFSSD